MECLDALGTKIDRCSIIRPTQFDALEINKLWIYQDKTVEEHKKMLEGIVKRDEKRRKRIKAAGIDYECPAPVSNTWCYSLI